MSTKTPKTKKRWIVGSDARRCGDYNCEGYDRLGITKSITVSEDGLVSRVCKLCEKTTTYQCTDWKELRACENQDCGWVRDVTVRKFSGSDELTYNKLCDACVTEKAARSHIYQASQLNEKAKGVREARRGKPKLKAEV